MASSREFLLEYSRFHSIARDHLAVDPAELLPQHAETEVVALLHTTDCFSLDLDLLRKFSIGSYEEKLSVSKACAVFLTSVVESSAPDYMRCAPKWDGLTLNRHRIANIKQEYPLLRTDPEYDMQLFQSSLSETRLDMDLPPEKLYNERDEGLSFPNYIHDLPVHIQEQIAKEKLDCTREVLVFLQELVNASAAPPVCPDGKRSPNYSRLPNMDPITPPLMPRDLTSTPFIPSSPCMRMEILSEPETPVLPGREELEAALLAGTNISSDEASDSDGDGIPKGNVMDKFIKVQGTTKLPASGLITHKKRPLGECMKVDAPLTPPVSTKKRCVNAKVNSLAEILESNPLPSVVPLVENAPFNLENLLPTSISAKQQIEQQIQRERIRGADAGVCAEIPQLPDSFPKPPWPNTSTGSFCQGCPVEYSRTSVAQLSRDHCFFIQTGISEGHEQNLRWNPFPQGLPKVETEELIGNDTAISEILAESKRPSDEYKLLERPRPARDDLGSTDSDLPGDVTVYKEESSRLLDIPLTQQEEKHAPSTKEKRIPLLTQVPETLDGQPFFNDPRSSLLSSQFSAFRNLSTFMRMRGSKCQNQNSSNQHSSELLETSEATHNSKIRVGILEDVVTGTEATIPGFGPPAGGTPQTTFPLTFILSTSLLRSYRCVIQSLEGLSTPRFLVFRDYSAMAFQLNEQQGDDADIVISPTTGILLTTSQETTQLYLPGQSRSCFQLKKKLRSPLWERISHVCSRYDQLYVLIIHPFQVKGGLKTSLDENVLNSIRELMSFCSSIYDTCNVMPLVLDLKCLPQWIVTLARRHAVRISWSDNYSNTGDVAEVSCSAVPCEDPDVWEYFLYQAGLNCFAARMVLSSPVVSASGQPDSQGGTLSPRDAFSNFMSLQSRHRARVYGPLIGEKLASRIGILLDAEW